MSHDHHGHDDHSSHPVAKVITAAANATGELLSNLTELAKEQSIDAFLAELGGGQADSSGGHDHHAHHGGAHAEHHAADHSAHGGHDAHAGHVMKMWFHGGCEEVILFDFWRTDSCFGLLFSCLLVFVMGAAYEGFKWYRVNHQMSKAAARGRGAASKDNGTRLLEAGEEKGANGAKTCHSHNEVHNDMRSSQENIYNPTTTPPMARNRVAANNRPPILDLDGIAQAGLYVVQLVLAYWLMLVVMTYNTYLTIAVILGAGFGHWLFAVLKFRSAGGDAVDSLATDACH